MRTLVVAALLLAFTSCFTPPALRPARDVNFDRALASYPSGSEPVSIAIDPDVTLRGVFVPSDPNAPVVLHLLESSGSAASARGGYATLTQELSDLGFASLLVDYTGIGASSGSPTPDNLARDTRAMWDEAVRRAGGDASRVVVRATSIGTLAAGTLLDSGVRPRAVALVLPVMADTVVRRFAREFRGVLAAWVATALYTDVVDVALDEVVRRARVPIVALSSPDEHFVDAAERRRLKDAVEESGGRWCERPGGHLVLTCDTRILFAEEIELLRSVHAPPAEARARTILAALPADVAAQFADGSPDRARLEALCAFSDCREPLRTAAVAQRSADADEGWRLLRILPRIAHGKSFEGLCALCDLDDPAGRMSIDTLERGCRVLDTFERFGVMRLVPTPEQLAAVASGETCRCSATISFTSTIQLEMSFDAKDIRDAVNELPLSRADAQRQTGRLLLKMFGYADRVRTGDAITVEALHGGVWRAFEPLPDGEDWAIHVEFGFLPGDPPDPNGGMLIRARQP